MENWDNIIFPISRFHMSQPIMNNAIYFNNKKVQEKIKTFKISSIRKLISPLNVQASKTARENTKNLSNLIHGQTQRL